MQLFYFAIIITLRNRVSRRLSDDEIKFNPNLNRTVQLVFFYLNPNSSIHDTHQLESGGLPDVGDSMLVTIFEFGPR